MYRDYQDVADYGPVIRSVSSDGAATQEMDSLLGSSMLLGPPLDEEIVSPRISSTAERYLNSRHRRALELVLCWSAVIFFLPLLCVIALAVRLTTTGPVLFKQLRYGQGMAMFQLMKFRSMYWDDDPDPAVKQATPGDPRITPLGRLLRCTSLDELPQLFSVIKGEMSLIGPRPHAIQHDVYYRDLIPNYCARFGTRPGLTGLAQVSGARGSTPRIEDMERRIELDLLYLQTASLKLDFHILLKTLKEIVKSDAAY